jgi:ATP-dependent Lon protease
MSKDTKQTLVKSKMNKNKKVDEKNRKKKNNESSEDDSGDQSYYPSEESEVEEEMDSHEYRKFLQKIFPSKYLDNKIKAGDKVKKAISLEEDESSDSETSNNKNKNKNKKLLKNNNNNNNKKEKPKEEEVWETDSQVEEEEKDIGKKKSLVVKGKKYLKKKKLESDSEDLDEEKDNEKKSSSNKVNIIFTLEGGINEEEWDDDYEDDWDDDDYEDTENEDESVSTSDSEDDEDEDDEDGDGDKEGEDIEEKRLVKKGKEKNSKKNKTTSISNKPKVQKEENVEYLEEKDVSSLDLNNDVFLNQLKEIYDKNKKNILVQKCIGICEENIQKTKEKKIKKEKKHKSKNLRIFRKIIKDKNTMNDFAFFEKLEIENQIKMIKELREINKIMRIEKPYRMTLLESDIPTIFKSSAMKKINSLRYMEPGSGEFYKIKNWVDAFMRIPFNNFNQLPVNIDDGVDRCHDFMKNAQIVLNNSVYGLNDAKMQIMQLLGQLVTNPKAIGTAIAIHGPPGTGKTTLLKEGVSKILNRPFAFIALGGATDSSFLEGHSYTYEGSTWGKIVQILIDSKCMNPVIYFDELDKISDTPRGEEITGILTHLTDTSQNSQFHDKYFAEIDFDLSKCLFIFSYNDESKVNPILKDRMYRIQTKGYNLKEKTVISNDHLLPKIREQVKFYDGDIVIPDETIHYLIDHFCNKEDGVRNLKRCLEIIHTKLNLYRLMKSDSNLFEEEMSLKVEFPFTVTKDIVDKLIKVDKGNLNTLYSMYV